jgi:hypothetical protein
MEIKKIDMVQETEIVRKRETEIVREMWGDGDI